MAICEIWKAIWDSNAGADIHMITYATQTMHNKHTHTHTNSWICSSTYGYLYPIEFDSQSNGFLSRFIQIAVNAFEYMVCLGSGNLLNTDTHNPLKNYNMPNQFNGVKCVQYIQRGAPNIRSIGCFGIGTLWCTALPAYTDTGSAFRESHKFR